MQKPVLHPADILLPAQDTDLARWAVLACDQFTSQPEYWQDADAFVGDAPSTLRMILPEVFLEDEDVPQRIADIHKSMNSYLQSPLVRRVQGYIYVERTLQSGAVRQGLVGCVDLEDYSYQKGAKCRIRPSEDTVVERIPPRLAVRRGASLESPHILMLADDTEKTILETLAAQTETMQLLYDVELMLGGGRLRGWAVPADVPAKLMRHLEDGARFKSLYGSDDIFALIVGDGNHSLATAKAYWEEIKATLPEGQSHPARYCLVELENVQSEAIEIEPIHRVIFGADGGDMLRAAQAFAEQCGARLAEGGAGTQSFVALWQNGRLELALDNAPHPLAVGSLEMFLQQYMQAHPDLRIDYVHGEDAVAQLAAQGALGILLPPVAKGDLFRGVALGGVLPKKTFSMGHAEEKRYYMECREI